MANADISATWDYHNGTKHSPESVRSSGHYLDWPNQPRPYKLYAKLEGLPLPQDFEPLNVSALQAVASAKASRSQERLPDLKTLSTVLHFSAGVTKRLRSPGGEMAFRAAACTGALYHIELYVVCGELPSLDAGVYHYGVHDTALRRLRSGDYRAFLAKATGMEPAVAEAPATVVCTSTYWRNAWKYQSRAYRHCFWDNGTILANMLAMAWALDLPARVVTGFADDDVNRLLDVDDEREVAVSLVPLGYAPTLSPGPAPGVERLNLETVPPSSREVDYPAIRSMHSASRLTAPDEVSAWRVSGGPTPGPAPAGETAALLPLRPGTAPEEPIDKVISRRGSTRSFDPLPITFEELSTMLAAATSGAPADFFDPPGPPMNDLYLIVNSVDGLASGTYVLHQQQQALELLRLGAFRDEAGYLDLGQQLGADAAVNIYFLADLGPILARHGNRGYRIAQLEASITAGKLYLAAYALRLGATGLTFFDDDVTSFFSPHAQGKSVMFLMALGKSSSRRST